MSDLAAVAIGLALLVAVASVGWVFWYAAAALVRDLWTWVRKRRR